MPLRLTRLPAPPFAQDKRHGGLARTWLLPVGITALGQDQQSADLMPLAGAREGCGAGFSHIDVLQAIDDKMTVVRIAAMRLMDEAKAGGSEAESHAEKVLDRLTKPRGDFANLPMSKPQIMGILNTTPDSFSDGGEFKGAEDAIAMGEAMIKAGAAILDVGGESTRPGAEPIGRDEECRRILPVIAKLSAGGHVVSADTRHTEVMGAALDSGAMIINDVGGLRDDGAIELVAERKACTIIMHMQGTPEDMQKNPQYGYAPTDIYDWLEARVEAVLQAGGSLADLAIDPGFGFGKTPEHNMMIMANMALFHGIGVPIVLGVSRKSTIAHFAQNQSGGEFFGESPKNRVAGSVALAGLALQQGVQIFRVHDVKETVQALGNAAAYARARV